jgi:hypothetical protein
MVRPEYDTAVDEGPQYTIPAGSLVRLVYLGNEGIPFSTVRRAAKYEYYLEKVGEWFDIAIESAKPEETSKVEQTTINLSAGEQSNVEQNN